MNEGQVEQVVEKNWEAFIQQEWHSGRGYPVWQRETVKTVSGICRIVYPSLKRGANENGSEKWRIILKNIIDAPGGVRRWGIAAGIIFMLLAWSAGAQTAAGGAAPRPTVAAARNTIPFAMDVNVGYANYQINIKPGLWYPVWTLVEAKAADIQGRLTIQQPKNTLQVSLPIQVAKGSKKLYLSYYQFDAMMLPELSAEITAGRQGRDSLTVPLRYADEDEQHILILADEPGGFSQLAHTGIDLSQNMAPSLASDPRVRNSSYNPIYAAYGGTRVIYGAVDLLPDDPIALEGLDGMVINTAHVRSLTARQWEAVRAWMMRGGRLLLAGGKNQPFIEQSVIKGAFGLSLAPAGPVSEAEIFGAAAGGGPGGKEAPVARLSETSQTLLVSWPGGSWARRVLGNEKQPLLVSKPVGRGWFHLCGAALDANMMSLVEKHADPERFWPPLLERHFMQTPLEQLAGKVEGGIGYELQRPFGFNLVGAGWVFTFLGCYILLALPLNWFICGRLKRREWAWPVAIALALGFAYYGYTNGLRNQSSSFQANEVTFVMQPAGAPTARAVTFSTIFSPRRINTTLQAGVGTFPNRLNQRVNGMGSYYQEDLYSDRALSVGFLPAGVMLGDFFFYPWSARNLRTDFTTALSGGVTVDGQAAPAPASMMEGAPSGLPRLGGRIVNHSPWRFQNWWITDGNRAWLANRPLEKGAALELAGVISLDRYQAQIYPNAVGNSRAVPPSNLNSLSLIIQDSIRRKIIDPAQKEMGVDGKRNFPSDQAWQLSQRALRPSSELFFLGEAEGALSPMTASMKLDRRRGILLYEAALQTTETGAGAAGQTVHWTPVSLVSGMGGRGSIFIGPSDSTQFMINAVTTDLQLIPDRAVDLGSSGSLTLAFRMSNANNQKISVSNQIIYYPATGQIRDVQGKPIPPENEKKAMEMFKQARSNTVNIATQYEFAGCPVLVYNLRLRKWESTRIFEDGQQRLTPLKDYLNPGTGALTVRIDADPTKLRFRAADGNSEQGKADLKTGVELWGNNNRISTLKITELRVTISDAGTSAVERRQP